MPGYLPGIPGAAVFVTCKFGGYVLAGRTLKRWQPAIMDSATKIAIGRTILGISLGPVLSVGMLWIGSMFLGAGSNIPVFAFYPFLFLVRIFVWALVIYYFVYGLGITGKQLWSYALLGAVWSCFLDIPGFFLALIAPGRIGFC